MPTAILLAGLILGFLVCRRNRTVDWRRALLLSSVLWGGLVTLITESLSVLKLLEFWPLAGAWSLACIVLLLILYRGKTADHPRSGISQIQRLSLFEKVLLAYLAALIVLTGLLAWFSPPNTWDSMTYHMSRVAHWMQNRTVDFYPTAILRQLHSNPWAEYAILNFQILGGTDRFANFVQWFCMVGAVTGVSVLAKELGAERRGQIFAAVACGTIPMGILQSTSTQTDYVAAFWLVCFVYFSLRLRNRSSLVDALGLGLALGLALLTKGTSYVFAFPFVVWLIASTFRKEERKKLLLVGLALMITFISNAGHYYRNYDLYGSPLGPGTEGGDFIYTNQVVSPAAVTSNILRNVGLHLGSSERANRLAEKLIYKLHTYIGIQPNDPRTTWPGTEFHVQRPSLNEDDAGNFVHLLLIAGSLILCLAYRTREPKAIIYTLTVISAFIFFCAYLKWQPWHSRLQLPLFVLSAPLLGLALSRLRKFGVGSILVMVLMLSALPSLLFSATKPIQGKDSVFSAARDDQYFIKRRELAAPYTEAAQFIASANCPEVGLSIDINDWEYPLWILLNEKMNGTVRLEHVNVTNVSRQKYPAHDGSKFVPCAVFKFDPNAPPTISVAGKSYSKEWSSGPVNVYTPGQ